KTDRELAPWTLPCRLAPGGGPALGGASSRRRFCRFSGPVSFILHLFFKEERLGFEYFGFKSVVHDWSPIFFILVILCQSCLARLSTPSIKLSDIYQHRSNWHDSDSSYVRTLAWSVLSPAFRRHRSEVRARPPKGGTQNALV